MAITVPDYRQRTVQQQATPSAFQRIDAPDAAFGTLQAKALVEGGTAIQRLGQQWGEKTLDLQKEANQLAALERQNADERRLNSIFYDPQNGILTRKGRSALDADKEVAAAIQKMRAEFEAEKNVAPEVRDMMGKFYMEAETRYTGMAQRHGFDQYLSYKNDTLQAQKDLNVESVALNYMDDKLFHEKWQEQEQLLQAQGRAQGWDDTILASKKREEYGKMRAAQIDSMTATGDPSAVIMADKVFKEASSKGQIADYQTVNRLKKYFSDNAPKAAAQLAYKGLKQNAIITEQSEIIDFVVDKIEGGDAIAKEPKGAIAKYGINSAANPDVDVANLTPEKAREIYKERYWKAYGIDSVPENMRLLAFDIAVNHRSDFARDAIGALKRGVSYDTVMKARLNEYERLAAADSKEYGPYKGGWNQRLETIDGAYKSSETISLSKVQEIAKGLDMEYDGAGDHLMELYATGTASEKAEIAAKKRELELTQQNNRGGILDLVSDTTKSTEEKLVMINNAELVGTIDGDFAADARRLLNSADNVVENPQLAADLIVSIHDLNASADEDPAAYLSGINNVRMAIARASSEGQIGMGTRQKLENQLKTLTSAKEADATKNVSYQFKGAQKLFEVSLPPEFQGQAIRSLFYATSDPSGNPNTAYTKEQYQEFAHDIIDNINKTRRENVMQRVAQLQNGTLPTTQAQPAPAAALDTTAYESADDVKEALAQGEITREQAVGILKTKFGFE